MIGLGARPWGDNASILVKVLSPPQAPSGKPKDTAKVLWKVPLRVEDKRSLLHILTDLLKDHVGGRGEGRVSDSFGVA